MFAAMAIAFLAAAVPSDKITSVAVAEYWLKKDSRGKGDEIAEKSKPRSYPAFAVSEDTFLVRDPFVRERHLDRIELSFRGDKVPAKEVARIESHEAVVLKAGRPLKGVVPLAFGDGEAKEKVTWSWSGDTLVASASNVASNAMQSAMMSVVVPTGRIFRDGQSNTLYLDKDRNPVWLDFGARTEVPNGKFEYVKPSEWARVPADSFEKSAAAIEASVVAASLPLLIRLEPEDKDDGRRHSRYGEEAKNELDALGFAIAGRVVVSSDLKGDRIARLSKVEATFPDGSVTNLVFVGALAEWNAMVFDVPEPFKAKLKFLEVAKCAAIDLDNRVAWPVKVENENGRVFATAERRSFKGVELVRGAKPVPYVRSRDHFRSSSGLGGGFSFVLDGDGRIASILLGRRFGERWDRNEDVAASDLARFAAGEGMNPEFAPRSADERNRLVWLGVETVRLTDALARERKSQSFAEGYSRPPYVTEVYPGSPAEKAGIVVGDILLAVRRGTEAERELEADSEGYSRDWSLFFSGSGFLTPDSTPWPEVESRINVFMTLFGVGAKVTLIYARDGQRRETTVWLEAAPVHYRNAPKARNRALGLSVKDMTFEVRRYFKFDDKAPGIVIAKVKPGSPAAVAGLKPFELVTEVNGEKVSGAKDFAAKIKGKKDLVFAVRRLAQTRMVKIHVEPEKDKEKGK